MLRNRAVVSYSTILLLLIGILPVYGTGVYVEDDNAILITNPSTIGSSGWVEFTFTSKKYTGQIDSVWGFNVLEAKPRRAEIWKNYTHDLYRYVWANVSRWVMVSDITGYTQITYEEWARQPNRVGNMYNPEFYEINGTIMEDPETLYMGVESWSGNMASLNVTYLDDGTIREEYQVTYPDWKPVSPDYQVIDRDFAGMNRWYALKNIDVVAGETYKLRIWLDVPFRGLERSEGKYAWGIKRSSDTLQEAIDSGRFYFIDPWWDSQWSHRVQLTFNNSASSENLTSFPVMVYLDSTRIDWGFIQNDGDDLRFVDSDDTTELAYEIEAFNYTTSEAYLWVRVPQIDNGSVTDHIWVYYGNPTASSGENITGTWSSDYVMVQHLPDNSTSTTLDSTQYDNDGTKFGANEPLESTAFVAQGQGFDGTNDIITIPDSVELEKVNATSFIVYPEVVNGLDVIIRGTGVVGGLFFRASMIKWYKLPVGWTDLYNVAIDDWYFCDWVLNGTHGLLYVNGTIEKTIVETTAWDLSIANIGNDAWNQALIGRLDEMRISNTTRSAEWIEAQYLSMTDALITYGTREIQPINLLVRVLTQAGLPISGVLSSANGSITDSGFTNATGWVSLDIEYGNNTLELVEAGYHNYLSTMLLEDNTTLIVAMIPDTELAGLGILPLFIGFMAVVVILAARKRR